MNIFFCSSLSLLVSVVFCDPRKNQACEMLVVIDETLFVSYGSDIRTVINLVDEHIGRFHLIHFFNMSRLLRLHGSVAVLYNSTGLVPRILYS